MLLSIAFVAGLTSTPALADDAPDAGADDAPYVTVIVPRCKVYDVPVIGEVCGYIYLDDWKAVAAADAELVLRRAEVKALAAARDAERDRADANADAITLREDLVESLTSELDDERRRYLELDRRYQEARGTPWHAWVGWGIAAVAVGALAGFAIAEVSQ